MRYKMVKVASLRVSDSSPIASSNRIISSNQAVEVLKGYFISVRDDQEHFVVLSMNAQNQIICISEVFKGGSGACAIDLAPLFKNVLVSGAVAFIIAHNHPSGGENPSNEDISLTRAIDMGSKTIGLQLLDHIIIGDGTDNWFSFKDNGLL